MPAGVFLPGCPLASPPKKKGTPFEGVPLSRFVAEEYGSTAPGGGPQGEVKVIAVKIATEKVILSLHGSPSLQGDPLLKNEVSMAVYTSDPYLSNEVPGSVRLYFSKALPQSLSKVPSSSGAGTLSRTLSGLRPEKQVPGSVLMPCSIRAS